MDLAAFEKTLKIKVILSKGDYNASLQEDLQEGASVV